MNGLINFLLSVVVLVNFIVLIVVLPKKIKNKNSVIFALLSLGSIFWSLSILFFYNNIMPAIFLRGAHFSALLIGIIFIYFSLIFPKKNSQVKLIVFILSMFFVPLAYWTIFSNMIVSYTSGISYELMSGYVYYSIWIGVQFILGIVLFVNQYIHSRNIKDRKKVAYILIGWIITVLPPTVTNLIFPVYNIFNYTWIGPIFTLVLIFSVMLAVIKYKLFHIRIIATEVLVFLMWVFLLVRIFTQRWNDRFIDSILLFTFVIMGVFLIRGISKEISQTERLKRMTKRLARGNEKLKELDKAKSEFISIIAHQLRTPPTIIKGYITMVKNDTNNKFSESSKKSLEKAMRSNDRLIALIEDVLNVSRMDAGGIKYNMQEKQICESVLDPLMDSFFIKAKNKNLKLVLNKPKKPLPKIIMDSQKVKETISNIIDNAIKYTKKGGVTITVKKTKKKMIRVEVKDTGVGITKEDMPELFKKFSRGKNPERLGAEGTGLGIYVSKKIISDHGGKIWAESEGADKGSTFIVELPIKK